MGGLFEHPDLYAAVSVADESVTVDLAEYLFQRPAALW
jgi:hypothetical protein